MYRPPFVSEREVAHVHNNGADDNSAWEDCVFCSGNMLANAATLGKYPATLTEAEDTRDVAGASATGTTNNDRLSLGLQRRYGWTGKRFAGTWSALLAAAPVGSAIAFAGSFAGFPAGHRLRRWQPSYLGGHEIFAGHEATDVWLVLDPLGPKDGSYAGDVVGDAEIRTFLAGNSDGGIAVQIGAHAAQGVEMFPVVTRTPLAAPNPRTFTIAAGKVLNGYSPAQPNKVVLSQPFLAASSAHVSHRVALEWIGGRPSSPDDDNKGLFLQVSDGPFAGLLIVASAVTLEPEVVTAPTGNVVAAMAAGYADAKTKAVAIGRGAAGQLEAL